MPRPDQCSLVRLGLNLLSHQRQQPRVEEHVALGDVHAADQLPQVGPVIHRDVASRKQHVALQHAVQIDGKQLHTLRKDQLGTQREAQR